MNMAKTRQSGNNRLKLSDVLEAIGFKTITSIPFLKILKIYFPIILSCVSFRFRNSFSASERLRGA